MVQAAQTDRTLTSRTKKIITSGIYDPLPTAKLSGAKLRAFEAKYHRLSKDLVGLVEEGWVERVASSETMLPLPASNQLHKLFKGAGASAMPSVPPAITIEQIRAQKSAEGGGGRSEGVG